MDDYTDKSEEFDEAGEKRTPGERRAVNLALMGRDVRLTLEKVKSIETKLESNYVTKAEFQMVQRLVYGFVGLILLAFAGALVALVIK